MPFWKRSALLLQYWIESSKSVYSDARRISGYDLKNPKL